MKPSVLLRVVRQANKTRICALRLRPISTSVPGARRQWSTTAVEQRELKLESAPPILAATALPNAPSSRVNEATSGSSGYGGDGFMQMDIDELVGRFEQGLQDEHELAQLREAMVRRMRDPTKWETLTPSLAVGVYYTAQQTRMFELQLQAFEWLLERCPGEIKNGMFLDIYRALTARRLLRPMWKIYELSKQQYKDASMPEIAHRMGVVCKILNNELADAQEMVDAMMELGVPVSNEIKSRLMEGYARARNKRAALAVFELMDQLVGTWNESTTDRVLFSLGLIREPQKAFEFYVNSDMQLSGSTLITLLSVCVNNECRQEAADILENRKRFKLVLDSRAYDRILETLVFLDRKAEIAGILDEMKLNSVRFTIRTREIIRAHQDVLRGTVYEQTAFQKNKVLRPNHNWWVVRKADIGELKTLVLEKSYEKAAAFADKFARALTRDNGPAAIRDEAEVPDGVLQIHASMAKWAVDAYARTGQHDKVDGILKGVQYADRPKVYVDALHNVLREYQHDLDGQGKLAHQAVQVLLRYDMEIRFVQSATRVLEAFEDEDGLLSLCDQLKHRVGKLPNVEQGAEGPSKTSSYDDEIQAESDSKAIGPSQLVRHLRDAVHIALFVMGCHNSVEKGLALIDSVNELEVRISRKYFDKLLRGLAACGRSCEKDVRLDDPEANVESITQVANAFEMVFAKMDSAGFPVEFAQVRRAIPTLALGNEATRGRLLSLYKSNSHTDKSTRGMRNWMYTSLMKCALRQNDYEATKQVVADALGNEECNRLKEWSTYLVLALTKNGELQEAFQHLLQIKSLHGTQYYPPWIVVLRAAVEQGSTDMVTNLLEQFHANKFFLSAEDLQGLIQTAQRANHLALAVDVASMFQKLHAIRTSKSVISSDVTRKLRETLRGLLHWCEQQGEWKYALTVQNVLDDVVNQRHAGNRSENTGERYEKEWKTRDATRRAPSSDNLNGHIATPAGSDWIRTDFEAEQEHAELALTNLHAAHALNGMAHRSTSSADDLADFQVELKQ